MRPRLYPRAPLRVEWNLLRGSSARPNRKMYRRRLPTSHLAVTAVTRGRRQYPARV